MQSTPSLLEEFLVRHAHRIKFTRRRCWIWTGNINTNGYGTVSLGGKRVYVHRALYEALRGPVPKELDLDHLCHVFPCRGGSSCPHRRCVNPEHLRPATRRENVLRGVAPSILAHVAGTCMRGHVRTSVNTYISPRGIRKCRTCASEKIQASRLRRKREAANQ